MNDVTEIRDIKGLIDIYSTTWIWLVLTTALLALVGALLYFLHRRKKRKTVTVPLTPPRSPYALALERLGDLRKWSLDAANMKQFHFALSDIIRTYLEGAYGLPATDRTIEEIAVAIKSLTQLSPEQKASYVQLLKDTDLVKFTDHDPGTAKSQQSLEMAEKFVRESQVVTG